MKKFSANDVESKSLDLALENLRKLHALFPTAVTETSNGMAVDLEEIKRLTGATTSEGNETYGLNWRGKGACKLAAQIPSSGTLRPAQDLSVNWDDTQNLLIQGDNLEVLKLLQRSYAGKVKAIYIDPPYNTGRNLLYPNDFQDGIKTYQEVTGQTEGGIKMVSNPESSGRFHTNWLTMIYPRLRLARELLAKDGVLIVTIDDNEQTTLGTILKEVFGEGSYEHVCVPVIHNPRGVQGNNFSYVHEYAFFVYPANTRSIAFRKIEAEEIDWSPLRNWGTESERTDAKNCFYPVKVKDGVIIGFGDVSDDNFHPKKQAELIDGVHHVYPIDIKGVERKWRYARQSVEEIQKLLRAKQSGDRIEIEIGKDFALFKTIWNDTRYDANEYGTQIVRSLVPDSPFTFPKSLWAVYDALYAATANDPNAIVMDFFAGSGTTAHAVMELNKTIGGNRRFILVQIPEPIDKKEETKFKTIFEVTHARIAAAGKEIAQDPKSKGLDLGFRCLKLDSSNLREWDPATRDVQLSMLQNINNIKDGRTESDILFELMAKVGIDLSASIETKIAGTHTIYCVSNGKLFACLSAKIGKNDIDAIAKEITQWHARLKRDGDSLILFRDSGFDDDIAKTNITAILNQNGLTNIRSV